MDYILEWLSERKDETPLKISLNIQEGEMSNNCDKWLLSRLEEGKVTHPYAKDLDI